MTLATLEDRPVTRASVAWPTWGLWWADVDCSTGGDLTGRVALTLAGTVFSGKVIAGGDDNGRSTFRLVAGAGGVSKALPERSYVNDAGVTLSSVLADAAREAGETLVTAGLTTRLGPHYARQRGTTLADLLERHCPAQWYADPDGTIRIGARATSTYEGEAPRVRSDPRLGVVDLAANSLEGFAPGVQVDGNAPATDLQIDLTPERLTVRVYFAAQMTRRLRAYRAIVRAAFPTLAYLGAWEYRVVTQTLERLNLQPARVASGMPSLANVPVRPGIAGAKATVALGELVLVCFADGDPSRPQVFAHGAADAPGFMPLMLQLGDTLPLGVARVTDTVQAGPFAGVITSASARIKAGI